MEDKVLVCSECGELFVFSEGEQEYYAQKNFSEPKRCKRCRRERRRQRSEHTGKRVWEGKNGEGSSF